MRWTIIAMMTGVMAAGALAQQQAPQQQPDDSRSDHRGQSESGRYGGMGQFRGTGLGPRMWAQPPDEDEWNRIEKFWKENSPRRWEAYTKLSQERQNPLRGVIWRRYRALELIKSNDPQIYDLRVKRMKVEDELFGLTRDLRNASPDKENDVRQKLKTKVAELVDLGVQERQARIDRWQKQIEDERKLIAKDKQDRDQTIAKRMRAIEKESGTLGDETATTQQSDSPATQSVGDAQQ